MFFSQMSDFRPRGPRDYSPHIRGMNRPEGISSTNPTLSTPFQNRNTLENIRFGNQNLQVFPNSNISFKVLPHISLSKEEKCILDNLWISYNRNPQDKKYFIACLNSLSEHFNINKRYKFYVVVQGKKTGFFHTWIKVLESVQGYPKPFYKGFNDYQQALTFARYQLGMNFYISDSLKHYKETPTVNYPLVRDNTKILFCDHCESMKNNFQQINKELYNLREEKQRLLHHISNIVQIKDQLSQRINNILKAKNQVLIDISSDSSGFSSDQKQKSKMGPSSPMSDDDGISKPDQLLTSPVVPAAGKDLSNPEIAMGLLKSQGTQRIPDSSTYKDKEPFFNNPEPQNSSLSSKNKNKEKIEIWDSLGEPGRHGDFLVKYTPTPIPDNLPEFPSFNLLSPDAQSPEKTEEIIQNIDQMYKDIASSSKKPKTYDKEFKDAIRDAVNNVIKDLFPKDFQHVPEKIIVSDDSSSKNTPLPSYLSCPNINVDPNNEEENEDDDTEDYDSGQDSGFSFDSIARHNLDT